MKRLVNWLLPMTLVVGGSLYLSTFFSYRTSDFYNFPIPKSAELLQESEDAKIYDWSRATEEKGIPFGYEVVLKVNGWEKREIEGASVFYTKRNHQINVIPQTKQLTIRKMK